jgi:uncharacterized membrane protein
MLAIGGWLGISYDSERITQLAAILFGAGGGLIGDEVGLLVTLGNYQSEITYSFVILFLASVSILILASRYQKMIKIEFTEFVSGHIALYVGVFLAGVSIAFITQTDNSVIIGISSLVALAGFIIILAYFINHIKSKI